MRATGTKRKRARFAIIGSAHVDILGISHDDPKHLDKVGHIEVRLGGSAYNVSVNLARLGYKVGIWTAVRAGSVVEKWIVSRLRREGVSTESISRDRRSYAGAFVANKHEGNYVSAVTSTGVDRIDLPLRRIRRLIRRSSSVIIDCNLSADQLSQTLELCNRVGKPITIASVSETKVLRFAEAQRASHVPVRALATDARIFKALENSFAERSVTDFHSMLGELCVSVIGVFDKFEQNADGTAHDIGIKLIFSDGTVRRFEETIHDRATSTGTRDALACGLAIVGENVSHQREFIEEFREISWPIICRVVKSDRTTIGNIEDEASLDNFGIEQEYMSLRALVFQRISRVTNRLWQIAAAILAAVTGLNELFPKQVGPLLQRFYFAVFGG